MCVRKTKESGPNTAIYDDTELCNIQGQMLNFIDRVKWPTTITVSASY
jgi:hypothetical protein